MATAFTRDELLLRAATRVAHVMRGMLEEKGSSNTDLLEKLLIDDRLVVVGRSSVDATYREHVIPRLVLCIECHRLIQEEGKSDLEVGRFIADNLKIVLLQEHERSVLDRAKPHNLRQRMPDGWKFGDDPFARLRVAGIQFEPYRLD